MSFSRQLQNKNLDEILAEVRGDELPDLDDADTGLVIQPLPPAVMLEAGVEPLLDLSDGDSGGDDQ